MTYLNIVKVRVNLLVGSLHPGIRNTPAHKRMRTQTMMFQAKPISWGFGGNIDIYILEVGGKEYVGSFIGGKFALGGGGPLLGGELPGLPLPKVCFRSRPALPFLFD